MISNRCNIRPSHKATASSPTRQSPLRRHNAESTLPETSIHTSPSSHLYLPTSAHHIRAICIGGLKFCNILTSQYSAQQPVSDLSMKMAMRLPADESTPDHDHPPPSRGACTNWPAETFPSRIHFPSTFTYTHPK